MQVATLKGMCVLTLILSVGLAGNSLADTAKAKPAEAAKAKLLWTVSEGLENPESALFDAKTNLIYVSNVAGQPTAKDGKGWISTYSPDGKLVKAKWADGLNAPKGLGSDGKRLWVSDIDAVVSLDLKTGKAGERIVVPDAKFLNDVAVGRNGDVFVSDMVTSKIHLIRSGKVETFLGPDKISHPNGLFLRKKQLIVATWGEGMKDDFSTSTLGTLKFIDRKSQAVTAPTVPFGNLDGLEARSQRRGWVVSDWMAGKVYVWDRKGGAPQVVIEGLSGAADIGYMPKQDIVLVPEMNASKLHAYQL